MEEQEALLTGCSGKSPFASDNKLFCKREERKELPYEESSSLGCEGLSYTAKLELVMAVFEPKQQGKSSA